MNSAVWWMLRPEFLFAFGPWSLLGLWSASVRRPGPETGGQGLQTPASDQLTNGQEPGTAGESPDRP